MRWVQTTCAAAATLMLGSAVGAVRGQADDKVYPLDGVVVNGLTGRPVARALVKSMDVRLATMTDDDGRFRVELHVPPATQATGSVVDGGGGYLELQVEKPGYLEQRGAVRVAIDSTMADTEVKLVLMPVGRIVGQVSATGVDAAAGVMVRLLQRTVGVDGRFHWMAGQGTATNSRGEFHFSDLKPGLYSLTTMEWNGDEMLEPQRDAVRKEYPAVFLGNGSSLEGATRVHVGYGESARVEVRLEPRVFYPVTIPVAGVADGLSVRLLDMGLAWNAYGMQFVGRDRAIEGWLPDGVYAVTGSSRGEQTLTAVVNLNVAGGPVRTKPMVLGPGGQIPVRVHDQRTKAEPATGVGAGPDKEGANQLLVREDQQPMVSLFLLGEGGPVPGATANDIDMNLKGADPGRYFVIAHVNRGYVAAMSSGGVDLLQDRLAVNASGGAEPIDVTLRDDTARAEGVVTGAGSRSCTVFFVPTDARGQYNQSGAERDGRYSIKDLAPGSYSVFALADERRILPYREADAMRPLVGKGLAVTVSPNQVVELDVPLLDVSAPEESEMEDGNVEM